MRTANKPTCRAATTLRTWVPALWYFEALVSPKSGSGDSIRRCGSIREDCFRRSCDRAKSLEAVDRRCMFFLRQSTTAIFEEHHLVVAVVTFAYRRLYDRVGRNSGAIDATDRIGAKYGF